MMTHESGEVIYNTDLDEWNSIGSGGFGNVHKVRHKTWGLDLAVKLLRHNSRPAELEALNKEANRMRSLYFEFVVRIYGIYDGTPPFEESRQQGIVMEFMRRGSVETLQQKLDSPPPLPLAFRLAHQVALGVNFLHSKGVLHCDLKPSNILLTDELKAKLADFGLSRVSTSVLNNDNTAGETGGTYKYMSPEAFSLSYKPVRSFDIYSYGVLLWSIFTGQEPYKDKGYSLVTMRILKGDRPNVELCQKQEEGMEDLVQLMTRCWDGDPLKRPNSEDVKKDIEVLFFKYKSKVNAAVYEVLSKLDLLSDNQLFQTSEVNRGNTRMPALPQDAVDHPGFTTQGSGGAGAFPSSQPVRNTVHCGQVGGSSLVQHRDMQDQQPKTSDSVILTKKQKAAFVDNMRLELTQRTSRVMVIVEQLGARVHPETYSDIKAKETTQKQMRELFNTTLRSGGDAVKAAFYDALKIHEPDLMEDLGG